MAGRRETLRQRLDRIEKRAPERKKRIIVVTEGRSGDRAPESDDVKDVSTDDSGRGNREAE